MKQTKQPDRRGDRRRSEWSCIRLEHVEGKGPTAAPEVCGGPVVASPEGTRYCQWCGGVDRRQQDVRRRYVPDYAVGSPLRAQVEKHEANLRTLKRVVYAADDENPKEPTSLEGRVKFLEARVPFDSPAIFKRLDNLGVAVNELRAGLETLEERLVALEGPKPQGGTPTRAHEVARTLANLPQTRDYIRRELELEGGAEWAAAVLKRADEILGGSK